MLDEQIKRAAADLYWAEGWLALYRAFEASLITSALGCGFPEYWLDAGCGDGRFAKLLSCICGSSGIAIGVDTDEVRLRRAKICDIHSGLVRSDLMSLPFPANLFDLIVCNSVLEHCSKPDDVLTEFHRVLRQSGQLLLTVPTGHFSQLLGGSQLFRFLKMNRVANHYGKWMSRRIGHLRYWDPGDVGPDAWGPGYRKVDVRLFCSPYISAVGDCLHILRMVGVGGSRFSRMEDRRIAASRLLSGMKQIATLVERRVMESEYRRVTSAREWGCLFVHAIKE